jgi:hypothetical protein
MINLMLIDCTSAAPWCSGLTCHPVTVEIVGSNPIGVVLIIVDLALSDTDFCAIAGE